MPRIAPRSFARAAALQARMTGQAPRLPTTLAPPSSNAASRTYSSFSAPRFQSPTLSSSSRPSILKTLLSRPGSSTASPFAPHVPAQQVRSVTYGSEYQPSQRKRKRKHGFLARLKSRKGRLLLARRKAQGRRFLSH